MDSEIEKWFSVYDKCMYCFLPVILYIIYRKNIPSLYKRFPGLKWFSFSSTEEQHFDPNMVLEDIRCQQENYLRLLSLELRGNLKHMHQRLQDEMKNQQKQI